MGQQKSRFATGAEGPWSFLGCLRQVSVWLGFALLVCWLVVVFAFEGVLREEDDLVGTVHTPFLIAASFTAGIVFLVLAMLGGGRPQARTTFIPHRAHGLIAVASGALVAAMVVYIDVAPELSSLVPTVGGMVWGLCFALMLLSWACLLSTFDLRSILVFICAALCLPWLLLTLLLDTVVAVKAMLAVVLPVGSFVCFVVSSRRLPEGRKGPAAPDEGEGAAAPREAPDEQCADEEEGGGTDRILGRLSVASFAFAAIIQFSWTFCIKQKTGGLASGVLVWVFVCTTAVVVATFVATFVLMKRQNTYRLELVYRAMLLFSLCGAASLPLAPYNLFLSYVLIYAGYSLLFPALYTMGFGYAFMRGQDIVRAVGCVCGMQFLGLCCGFVGEVALGMSAAVELASAAPYVALACVAVLGVSYTIVFPESAIAKIFPVPMAMNYATLDEKCAEIARDFGLSPRESDVLMLLARGRNAAHIAEALYISRNTVGTHRRNIYRKLGVHDQQELLSLVERAGGDVPR